MKNLMRLASLAVFAALVAGCYQVPVTGRRSMNLVDSKEVVKMSVTAYEDMKHTYKISKDKVRIEQLERVCERLRSAIPWWELGGSDWEFVVFEVPNEINAFAMAGGKVGVFTGLFKIIDTDDELASVLAHEFAHVTARHVDERLSRQLAMDTVNTIGGVALGVGAGGLTTAAVMAAYGLTNSEGRELAFDREHELEADKIGMIYMSEAGYDPRASIKLLEKLDEIDAGLPVVSALESTHPSNPQRVQKLNEELPRALKIYEANKSKAGPVK